MRAVRLLGICPTEELKTCGIPTLVLLGVSWLWGEVLTGSVCGCGGVGERSGSGLLAAESAVIPFNAGVACGSVKVTCNSCMINIKRNITEIWHM